MNTTRIVFSALAVASSLFAQAQKLSPNAATMLMHREKAGLVTAPTIKPYAVADSVIPENVRVFVTYTDAASLDSISYFGGHVYQTFDDCATAVVPVDNLRAFSSLAGISYVEMGSPVQLCNDVARSISGIDDIHSNAGNAMPQGYTGKGIVVGVIDTGLDYNHIAFRNADGSLRIKRVWNQNGFGKAPEAFGYGAELTAPDEIKAANTDTGSEYHGSHTTAIAAGSDRQSDYYGMAPDADIVFVSFGQNTVDIPNAVKYIFDYAESVGKPCVINMSLGSHAGPHNGNSALDRFFAEASGPGRLLVGSVGNEGASNMHIGKTFTATSKQLKTLLEIPSGSNKATAIDIWGSEGSSFTVKMILTDAKGKIVESSQDIPSSLSEPVSFSFGDDNIDGYFYIASGAANTTGEPNIYIECYLNKIGDTRNVGLQITGEDGASVNMWNLGQYSFVSGGFRGFSAGDNRTTAGEIGGTGEAVISVGSYNSRYTFPLWATGNPDELYVVDDYGPEVIPTGDISFFSSHGPTIDGRMKPDVLAPGALVVSAMNGYTDAAQQYSSQMVGRTVDGNGKAHYYYFNIGTSMAAPVVTGGLALWLEADPTLTPERVRDYISRSAVLDSWTGDTPGNDAGYGKFHALDGLGLVLADLSAIDAVEPDAGNVRAWYAGGLLRVSSPAADEVVVYNVLGAAVGSYHVDEGLSAVNASAWQPGIYIVHFARSGASVKIAVR